MITATFVPSSQHPPLSPSLRYPELAATKAREILADMRAKLAQRIAPDTPLPPRTYGFEQEFLPDRVFGPDDYARATDALKDIGFQAVEKGFLCPQSSLVVSFEPGGQFEFAAPPVAAPEAPNHYAAMQSAMVAIMERVERRVGVTWQAAAFAPGRADAPLCKTEARYAAMHERFRRVSTRGVEMMKATASLQFHAGLRTPEELPQLWALLAALSREPGFAAGADRADIWAHTDPTRTGLIAPHTDDYGKGMEDVLAFMTRYCDFALQAEDFATGRPAGELGLDALGFRNHLTTLFTDVRLNCKGPSLELRTPDSRPFADAEALWRRFVARVEDNSVP